MELENLRPAKGATKARKRVGRGPGSGTGKTSARGHKGQGSRSGSSIHPGFEGGQMPLQRRIPKRGFTNVFRERTACVNVGRIATSFTAGASIGPAELRERGLVRGRKDDRIKVLGDGEIAIALTIRAHAFTASAREKVTAAGGACEVIPG